VIYEGRIKGSTFKVILEDEDQVELSFSRNWDASMEGKMVPLNIDKSSVTVIWHIVLTSIYCI
jgi:rhamnogalacturonan endolyase